MGPKQEIYTIDVRVNYIAHSGARLQLIIHAFSTDDHEDVKALAMIACIELGTFISFETDEVLFRNTRH